LKYHFTSQRVYHWLSIRRRIIRTGGTKERGARYLHKRLLYYVNVNRTSLDHLLLGRNADVDKHVE
jgi:hypothetical protein